MFEADKTLGVNRWPLVRLLPGRRTEVVLLSSKFFCLTTHWVGRSVACPGANCPLCVTNAARGLWYLPVRWDSRVSLLELGAVSSSLVEQAAKLFGGGVKPGLVMELQRSGPKKPVTGQAVRVIAGVAAIEFLDLVRHVMCLYKFPPPNLGDDLHSYEVRCRSIAMTRVRRICDEASAGGVERTTQMSRA